MYGYTPSAATERFSSAPPEKMLRKPRIALLSKTSCSTSELMPGTGTCATKRKMSSIASVKRIFWRISGC